MITSRIFLAWIKSPFYVFFTTLLVALIQVHFLNRINRSKYIIVIVLSGPDIEDIISSVTLSIIVFWKMPFFTLSHLEWTITSEFVDHFWSGPSDTWATSMGGGATKHSKNMILQRLLIIKQLYPHLYWVSSYFPSISEFKLLLFLTYIGFFSGTCEIGSSSPHVLHFPCCVSLSMLLIWLKTEVSYTV